MRWGKGKVCAGGQPRGYLWRKSGTRLPPIFSTFSSCLPSRQCLFITHPISTDSNNIGCRTTLNQAISHQRNCLAASLLRHGSRAPGRVNHSTVYP